MIRENLEQIGSYTAINDPPSSARGNSVAFWDCQSRTDREILGTFPVR